jgi:hypothetical protein
LFAEVREGQITDRLVADKYESIKDINEIYNGTADCTSLCLTTTCPKTDDVTPTPGVGT